MTTLNDLVCRILVSDPTTTFSLWGSEERWEPSRFLEETKDQKGWFYWFDDKIYKDSMTTPPPFARIRTGCYLKYVHAPTADTDPDALQVSLSITNNPHLAYHLIRKLKRALTGCLCEQFRGETPPGYVWVSDEIPKMGRDYYLTLEKLTHPHVTTIHHVCLAYDIVYGRPPGSHTFTAKGDLYSIQSPGTCGYFFSLAELASAGEKDLLLLDRLPAYLEVLQTLHHLRKEQPNEKASSSCTLSHQFRP